MLNVAETRLFENPPSRPVEAPVGLASYMALLRRIQSAGRSDGFMVSFTIPMTPEIARAILERHNFDNRPLRTGRVAEFKRIIAEGRWRLTSQGISFSPQGQLNNGQHRLTAIADGEHTVEMYVTVGEDRDVFDVLDTGAVRGGADTLAIQGHANTALLASAARFLTWADSGTVFNAPKIANDVLGEIVASHPRLTEGVLVGMALGKRFRCSGTAIAVAAYVILTRSAQPHRFDAFYERVKSGTGAATPKDPILLLRDGLQTKAVDKHLRAASLKTFAQYAAVITAWNLYLRGRKGAVKWEPNIPLPVVE